MHRLTESLPQKVNNRDGEPFFTRVPQKANKMCNDMARAKAISSGACQSKRITYIGVPGSLASRATSGTRATGSPSLTYNM